MCHRIHVIYLHTVHLATEIGAHVCFFPTTYEYGDLLRSKLVVWTLEPSCWFKSQVSLLLAL